MKTRLLSLYTGLFLTLGACATANQPISDEAMGLSKTSVFNDPAPAAFEYPADRPGAGARYEQSYHTAPPMIPHDISAFVPVTQGKNLCLNCHMNAAMAGQAVPKGVPTPIPASHYSELASGKLDGSRAVCTLCHAPQAKVEPLVENRFGAGR
jgi:cytochrome c-type protein NapB